MTPARHAVPETHGTHAPLSGHRSSGAHFTRRQLLGGLGVVAVVGLSAVALPHVAFAQQGAMPGAAEGMERSGSVDVASDAEKAAFQALTCCCGTCPHESLTSCTCGFAHEKRQEIRAMLARGVSLEDIKADFAKRYGPEALAVPPNTGANRLLYLAPLVGIVAGAAFVIALLRRLGARGAKPPEGGASGTAGAGPGRDAYDDKLDDELNQLDQDRE